MNKRLSDTIGAAHVVTDSADMTGRLMEDRGLFTGTALAILRPRATGKVL